MRWESTSWENYELARERDRPLAAEYDRWLDALEHDTSDTIVRQHRFHTVDAWIIYVHVPGRDERYAIIWRDGDGAEILHLGAWNPAS